MTATNHFTKTGNLSNLAHAKAILILTAKSSTSVSAAVVGDTYDLVCLSQSFPKRSDPATWTQITDDPNEKTGKTYVGKPEKIETLEYKIAAYTDTIAKLQEHADGGDIFTLKIVYDDPAETMVYTWTTLKCYILNVPIEGGDINGAATATIKIQPVGGEAENMPICTTSARV